MSAFVVDASVAVKWFIPEIHSAAAVRLLDRDVPLAAPDLLVAELGNVLRKKIRREELTSDDASEILAAFSRVPLQMYASRDILGPALDIAVALDRSVYDCLYLALAIGLDARLVTADAKFHRAVDNSALAGNILYVEDEL